MRYNLRNIRCIFGFHKKEIMNDKILGKIVVCNKCGLVLKKGRLKKSERKYNV